MEAAPRDLKIHKKSFWHFFPTPKILLLTTIGVSLSDKFVQFVEFNQSGDPGEMGIAHTAKISLPDGAVVAGYINDKEALSKAIKELHVKHNFYYVRATLPEEKAYLFTVEVDREPFESLRDRVAFTIEENVPVTISKSVFDFEIIGKTKGKEAVKVAVTVLPKKVVEMYLEIFAEANVMPISFDIESQAIARSVIPVGDKRAHMIINLDEEKTGLYVVEDEVVQFSSTPGFGVIEKDESYPDILNLKIEVRRLLAFWNTRLDNRGIPEKKIEKMIITGPGAKKEKFVLELMSGMDLEYALANVWCNAFSLDKYLPEISFDESLSYGASVGVALPPKEPRYV